MSEFYGKARKFSEAACRLRAEAVSVGIPWATCLRLDEAQLEDWVGTWRAVAASSTTAPTVIACTSRPGTKNAYSGPSWRTEGKNAKPARR